MLAQWIAALLEPAAKRYFGKALRENVQKQIKEAADRGDLGALARIVDDPHRLQRDEQEFIAAEFNLSQYPQGNQFARRAHGKPRQYRSANWQADAASISCMLALLGVLFVAARTPWTSM